MVCNFKINTFFQNQHRIGGLSAWALHFFIHPFCCVSQFWNKFSSFDESFLRSFIIRLCCCIFHYIFGSSEKPINFRCWKIQVFTKLLLLRSVHQRKYFTRLAQWGSRKHPIFPLLLIICVRRLSQTPHFKFICYWLFVKGNHLFIVFLICKT